MSKRSIVIYLLTAFVLAPICVFQAFSPRERRDISTREKALLGHWKYVDSKTEP